MFHLGHIKMHVLLFHFSPQRSLTFEEVEEDLLQHGFVDLWVSDGVQQPSLLLAGKDELTELLPVDLTVFQEDFWPKVVNYSAVGASVWLHHCQEDREKIQCYSQAQRSVSAQHSLLNKTNTVKVKQYY